MINAERAAGVVGFLGGSSIDAGALQVTCERFGRDFAAVTALALDGKPRRNSARVLVTVVARAQNQGLTWNADRTSADAIWGHGPPITEHVPATIALQTAGCTVHALAPDGSRGKQISVKRIRGGLSFTVGPDDQTIHYEILGR